MGSRLPKSKKGRSQFGISSGSMIPEQVPRTSITSMLALDGAPGRQRVENISLGLLRNIENQNSCADFLESLEIPTTLHQNAILGAEIIFQIDESPSTTNRPFRPHHDR